MKTFSIVHDIFLRIASLAFIILIYSLEVVIIAAIIVFLGNGISKIFHMDFIMVCIVALASVLTIILFHGLSKISNELEEIKEILKKKLKE